MYQTRECLCGTWKGVVSQWAPATCRQWRMQSLHCSYCGAWPTFVSEVGWLAAAVRPTGLGGQVGASALVGWCYEATGFFLLLIRLMQLSPLMPNVMSESKSHYDWRPISMSSCQSRSGTHYQIYFLFDSHYLLSMWDALSDERSGLSPVSHC
jgi:hypothetical protein